MAQRELRHLSKLVREAMEKPYVKDAIKTLKRGIVNGDEPFLWKVMPKQLFGDHLPNAILSGWIFVLKPNIHTPLHSHPNSVQHTMILEGSGKLVIVEIEPEARSLDAKIQESWYIIPKGVPHKVITDNLPVVVFSFHTCAANELTELETFSGHQRFYES